MHSQNSSTMHHFPRLLLISLLACVGLGLPLPAGAQNTFYGSFAGYVNHGTANCAFGYDAMRFNDTGSYNTAVGFQSLDQNLSGYFNVAIGDYALFNNNVNGNTAVGYLSLYHNTSGTNNVAMGLQTMENNTTGSNNSAFGYFAMINNTTASGNTATGTFTLGFNSTGEQNTATGNYALNASYGSYNTGTGAYALHSNSGNYNTATGYQTLYSNGSGGYNTATGFAALQANYSGYFNTADGGFALIKNTGGYQNTGSGVSALYNTSNGHDNTALGYQALGNNQTGNNNIGIGSNGGLNVTGNNNIDIGAPGAAGESNTIRLGKTGTQQKAFIAGVSGKTVASGIGVIISSTGQLGTVQSSARFKTAIKPMENASDALLALKPVTFRYKEELDPDKIPQFGLIAEEVDKIDPDLVVRDEEGKVTSVRYEAVNAMLLNEFLKEHRKVEEQGRDLQDQKAIIARQQRQIEALAAAVQKVSGAVELKQGAGDSSLASH